MEALIKSGTPLDVGLRQAGAGNFGAVRVVMDDLALRLERGESLDSALAAEGSRLPALYRMVLHAGSRTGRLSEALTRVSADASAFLELRHSLLQALAYPLVVVAFSYLLFVLWLRMIFPIVDEMWVYYRWPLPWWIHWARVALKTAGSWSWGLPLLVAVSVLVMKFNRRSEGIFGGWLTLVPGFGRIQRDARWARFSRVLSDLIASEVPLPESLRVAGDAAGGRVRESCEFAAAQLEAGHSLESLKDLPGLPDLILWTLVAGDAPIAGDGARSQMAVSLRNVSEAYTARCRSRTDWLKRLAPAVLLLLFAGVTVIGFTTTVIGPLQSMWSNLADPIRTPSR